MKRTFAFIVLICQILLLSGCQDKEEDWDAYPPLTGTTWVEYYRDGYGYECEHILRLNYNGNGSETYTCGGHPQTYSFYWEWDSDSSSSLYIEYGPNDYIFFDVERMSPNILTGYFDGVYVEFYPWY